jgi:PAS domain S-box-containing protein
MVWTATPEGTITYANEQWLQFCGLTPDENTQAWPQLVLHPGDRERCLTQWAQALRDGTAYEIEVRNRRHDGAYRWLLTRAVPVRDAAGQITAWYGMTTDIHDRRQVEEERERLLTELQRINAELQQFAHIVSHDLGEPLRTMRSYVQLLERRTKGKLDGNAEEFMVFVADAAQRMQQMLTDLLAYTKVGQTPELQAVDCEDVLSQVLRVLHARITECEAVITHDPLPTVQGDAVRLTQVL